MRTVESMSSRANRSRTASAVSGALAQMSCITSRSRSPKASRLLSIVALPVVVLQDATEGTAFHNRVPLQSSKFLD